MVTFPSSRLRALTPEQIDQFIEQGYVIVRGAFDREIGEQVQQDVWGRVEAKSDARRDDPATWTEPEVWVQETVRTPAARAIIEGPINNAFADLTNGRHEQLPGLGWWPVTFPGHETQAWSPPTWGWHVDGSNFQHHIDSPEQGLLLICLLSDIDPGGGGTCIVPGSHKFAARVLEAAEPKGLTCEELGKAMRDCPRDPVVEVTGRIGDVAVMHPFMLHTKSRNTGDRVRFICNPQLSLAEPMNLDREQIEDYSPVEIAILRALDMEPQPVE